ncbi:pyrroloquinoline quinone biosynthesis protein E [Enhydrobacter aerosaccus]|uniref:PqqA peptide cyclase n=1 Tax=Enhydrobacter aerosaccus TaxID=225324 RepID=A0A1T4NVF2_9HYPH|nr:pyrroloquinoline quinone biosynthesis protein PqqE [Enhydrobacter aerosaccus]SJZ83107.1 pyrroloquinoline quinone biosynthesis protein E [Enhydrobacter aerosaccus]
MASRIEPPLALLAEVTHRCPLRCPYCSNPIELDRASHELPEQEWRRVLTQAAALGVLQVHFSGGEPMVRRDLAALIGEASRCGLYSNLITSGTLGGERELQTFAAAGLKHVQLSFQDSTSNGGDRIAGLPRAHEKKIAFAKAVRAVGLPLTLNVVVHRQNVAGLAEMIEMAVALQARRIEIAHVQYYGWALANRGALLPTREQLDAATGLVETTRERLKGVLTIDYVVPDYYAVRPKSCMNGWGRQFLNVTPAGKVVPCHAAQTIADLVVPSVRDGSLADIWYHSEAFNRFRGTGWMPEPCRSCDRREIDWGGCRCQAFLLAGDASRADPVCSLSPDHSIIETARQEAQSLSHAFAYRHYG